MDTPRPSPRTNRTRRVPHTVLIGHAASLSQARAEYEERGDESGLHVIIFDEMDAICKQRGKASGDAGVGDSVVNQLLSYIGVSRTRCPAAAPAPTWTCPVSTGGRDETRPISTGKGEGGMRGKYPEASPA